MGKILRINMTTKEYDFQDAGEYAGMGGRGLTSKLICKEVPPTCDALGPDNKLVMAAGMLAGTNAANSGRLSVGGKSPLTGGIKESNSGGQFALQLVKLGLQAIVFEGQGDEFTTVFVSSDKVEFKDASPLLGKYNWDAHDLLKEEYGAKAVTALCGPAGEVMRRASTIQFSDPEGRPARSAGRGGLGAVMGSKKIKAVVLDPAAKGKLDVADMDKLKEARKRWAGILQGHPVTGEGLPAFGTAVLVNIINEAGALPTKNFSRGRFEKVADISGEKIAENIKARGGLTTEGCHTGCVIRCSQKYNDADGNFVTCGFEYETVWAFGANCEISDIDIIAKMDHLCDELGLDTIEMGTAMAVAMEGGLIPWGDGQAAYDLLSKAATDDENASVLGDGTGDMGKKLGVTRVPVVKNQSLPAYDPRAVKGVGVTYATTPMGGDHTAGYAVCQNVLGVGGSVDALKVDGQIDLSKNLQIATAAIDATGMCLFVAFAVLDNEDGLPCMCDQVAAVSGQPCTPDDVVNLGISILRDEYDFNERAGFTKKDDQLPEFFSKEPLPPHNVTWTFTEDDLQGAKA